MKYFLDIDTGMVYSVPKKYQYLIDICNDLENDYEEWEIMEAKRTIEKKCKLKLVVAASLRTV